MGFKSNLVRTLVVLSLICFLASCGGGGSGDDDDQSESVEITHASLDVVNNRISAFKGSPGAMRVHALRSDGGTEFEFSLEEGPSWLEVDETGVVTYEVPESLDGGTTRSFSISVSIPGTYVTKPVDAEVFIIQSEVLARGLVGPGGGTISDESGEIALVIPSAALTSDQEIVIRQGRDADGNLAINADSGEVPIEGIQLFLPSPDVLDSNVSQSESRGQPRNDFNEQPQTENRVSRVEPQAGETECEDEYVDKNNDSFSLAFCWHARKAWFSDSILVFDSTFGRHRLPNGTRVNIFQRYTTVSGFNGAELWSNVSSEASVLRDDSFEPVLFVHGFTTGPGTLLAGPELGGGEGTWGKIPKFIAASQSSGKRFIPFEFRWRTNARFSDAADDLLTALVLISNTTQKKVHIVAHSFGGLLVRSLLQELNTSGLYNPPAESLVASLTTVGTPHSGIFNDTPDTDDTAGVVFPDGQDSLTFRRCKQISCYQAGGYDTFSPGEKQTFGLAAKPGELVSNLANTAFTNLSSEMNIQVLIGLTAERGFNSILDNGDALITFAGQRFYPELNEGDLLNQSSTYGAMVTESLLGFNDDLRPGDRVEVDDGVLVGNGFCHNSFSCSASTVGPPWFRNTYNEVEVSHSDCSSAATCTHPTWIGIKNTLSSTAGDSEMELFEVRLSVRDSEGNGVSGVSIGFASSNASLLSFGDNVTNSSGNVSVELPFYPYTNYSVLVFPPEGFRAAASTGTITTGSTPNTSSSVFPTVRLSRAAITFGDLDVDIRDASTGYLVSDISYSLTNNVGRVVAEGNADNGSFGVSELVSGMYTVSVAKPSYRSSVNQACIVTEGTNACSVTVEGVNITTVAALRNSFNPGACQSNTTGAFSALAEYHSCGAAVLEDFILTYGDCSLTKVADKVTLTGNGKSVSAILDSQYEDQVDVGYGDANYLAGSDLGFKFFAIGPDNDYVTINLHTDGSNITLLNGANWSLSVYVGCDP